MTTLSITADLAKKRLKVEGRVAAGEKVAVTVKGFGDKSVSNTRLRVMFAEKVVAIFPLPNAETGWTKDGEDLTGVLNLNTVQAEMITQCGSMGCFWVLDDVSDEVRQLYGTAEHELLKWVKRPDTDVPVDLDSFPTLIEEMQQAIATFKSEIRGEWTNYQQTLSAAWTQYRDSLAELYSQFTNHVSSLVNGKASAQDLNAHTGNKSNPHEVTKAQVGLGNVDNTKDVDKPVSTQQQTAINSAKEQVANLVQSEARRATGKEQELQNGIDAEGRRASSAESGLDLAIRTEKARAEGVEAALGLSKQDKLSSQQLAAVNSGIDASKVAQIAENTSTIAAERTRAQGVEANKADLVGGKVPSSQLPSYVDDVLEFDSASEFPVTGESGKIYIAKDTNKQYRWSGTQYVELGGGGAGEDTNAVHYYAETKTDSEKAQARSNIGAMSADAPIPEIVGKLPMRPLPKYLHYLAFDDTYPDDAAWLYAQLGPSDMGRCSAVRRGGKLWRKYDWTFDSSAEFAVKVSGNASRFASVGMASVGARLTENNVMSAVNSRYYKCLPGMTLDGINEKGVVAEINVDGGPKDGWHGDADEDGIHILAAVRWVLGHGETAAQAAEYIADHIIQPQGEMNFHFMVADAISTYIVENGSAHDVTDGVKVLTNYALYDEVHAGGGKERYNLLARGEDISAVNFTNAYQPGNDWDSDFDSAEQHAAAIAQWAAQGTDKEAHRGKTTTGGKAWWQSVHTTEYDFSAKTMKVAVQEVDDWYAFAVDAVQPSVTVDDTVTESSSNGVKSSGIWSWVKSLLPSWLTPTREEPPTRAQVDAKRGKYDLGVYDWTFLCDHPTIKFFKLIRNSDWWSLYGGENADAMRLLTTIFGDENATYLEGEFSDDDVEWSIVCDRSTASGELAKKTDIPALAAPSASATDAQAAKAKATYDFVNSSVNAMAAFFLAKDDGTSFATRAELAACTSFLRNGLTGQKPTQNDYTIVVNDETNPIYQAGVFAVYSKWTATDDYVGYWVDYNGAKTLVTPANKDSLGIVVGGNSSTVPYTRIVPTSRYSYQGEWETAGANGWRFQYSINTSGFTVAQLAALNSGASAELFAQIAQSLAAKANKNGDSSEDFAANEVEADLVKVESGVFIGDYSISPEPDRGLNIAAGVIVDSTVTDASGNVLSEKLDADKVFDGDEISDDFVSELMRNSGAISAIDARTPYSQIAASGSSANRSVKVYTATDTLPSPIPLPQIPTTGIIDLEVWIEAGSTAPSNVTFSPGIIPKDGKALEFAANSTNIIHLTARGGATHYTAVAAAFAAESSTQA